MILSKSYKEPPFCEKEILRYAGCKTADSEISKLLDECINVVSGRFTYNVCYRELTVKTDRENCDFGVFSIKSEKLALNLADCKKAIVFGATVGIEIDRLIAKYGKLSPAKALMLQAIGTERIEALCDTFCKDLAKELTIKPRFSPGYGDLPICVQRDIFSVLDCERKIGLTLNDNLLMLPTKSVTAFIGISKDR